ncbi:prepilin peptidase [Helicobacter cholecystus]|uniref:prepilin peptidase n=1 Tax=Helicobacter cholecystus TaxID=45498 RepID=UPI0027381DB9|nr:prepilin peptidase [Helicobacter cholecystus]
MLNDLEILITKRHLLWVGLFLLLFYGISTLCVSFFGRENKNFSLFLKQTFFSVQSLLIAMCIPSLFFLSIFLYGYKEYAWFIFIFLGLFFTLALIDYLKLAVPDILNFVLFFYVFVGLYYFNVLSYENFISSFALLGAFSLLRMFGGFVFNKEVMGEADLIVMGSIGALFPFIYGCYIIVISAFLAMGYILILGAFYYRNKTISFSQIKIPFILFLFLGFIVGLFYWQFPIFGVLNV